MERLFKTMRQTIEKYAMLQQGEKVLVGVSGGPDSICLLHALNQLRQAYGITVAAAHVNHKLRGDAAEEDARYVEEFCGELNIPLYIKNADIGEIARERKISEEAAGREERYHFFFETAARIGAAKIAVAQNMNDQAETMLMRFIRGAGLEGLSGISPIRKDGVMRPLLDIKREWIEEYCRQYDLKPRTDESNFQAVYTRNKLRLELIPQIVQRHNPNFIQTSAKAAEMLQDENEFLNLYIDQLSHGRLVKKENEVEMSLIFFLSLHVAAQRRIIRKAIEILKGDTVNIEFKHVESIIDLAASKKTGKRLDLPGGITVKLVYDNMFFLLKNQKPPVKQGFQYPLALGCNIEIDEAGKSLFASIISPEEKKQKKESMFLKFFDYDVCKKDICIRDKRNGDWFVPQGMKGTKKLKDYFIDMKVPREERDKIPLIAHDREIIWVVGYRANEKYICKEGTNNILMIEVIEHSNL